MAILDRVLRNHDLNPFSLGVFFDLWLLVGRKIVHTSCCSSVRTNRTTHRYLRGLRLLPVCRRPELYSPSHWFTTFILNPSKRCQVCRLPYDVTKRVASQQGNSMNRITANRIVSLLLCHMRCLHWNITAGKTIRQTFSFPYPMCAYLSALLWDVLLVLWVLASFLKIGFATPCLFLAPMRVRVTVWCLLAYSTDILDGSLSTS